VLDGSMDVFINAGPNFCCLFMTGWLVKLISMTHVGVKW
jgi:hypothetical protein